MGTQIEGDIGIGGTATTSWGVVMIHLPDHPDITKEQALDPNFSVDFLAKSIRIGRGNWWTCFRLHYKYVDNSVVALDN